MRSKVWGPEPIGWVFLKETPQRLFILSLSVSGRDNIKRLSASQKEDLHQKRVSQCPDTELPVPEPQEKSFLVFKPLGVVYFILEA